MQKNRKTVNVKSVNIQQAAEEFYLSNKAKGLTEATCEIYKTYISAFIQWYGASKRLNNLSPSTFEEYVIFKAEKTDTAFCFGPAVLYYLKSQICSTFEGCRFFYELTADVRMHCSKEFLPVLVS